jgi:cell wall-associated NlpC family hydrolase
MRPYAGYRRRHLRRHVSARDAAAAMVAGMILAAAAHAAAGAHPVGARGSRAAVKAITYARRQIGTPYCWGGTGPSCYDCSGLVMEAYRAAGVNIPRTSQQQWTSEPHVRHPQPGDLAFFVGSDGTWSAPGHVGLVIGHGHMIEAYASGVPIRVASYHRPDLVGFTRPAAYGG